MYQNIDNCFNEQIMRAVARRIARLAQVDPAAAENDYQQHTRDMSADEVADFDAAIVSFAMEMGG